MKGVVKMSKSTKERSDANMKGVVKTSKSTKERSGSGTRRRKTRIYDELLKRFRDNCVSVQLVQDQGIIAQKIGVSESSLSGWFGGKNLPSVDQLVLLAQALNVSPGWLLDGHSYSDYKNAEITYTEAYRILRPLASKNLINAESVSDYFLNYLLKRTASLDKKKNLPKERLDEWNSWVIKEFTVPVMPPLDKDLYKVIETYYGDIDDDNSVVNVLKVVRDYHDGKNREEIKDFYRIWWEENNPGYPFVWDIDDSDDDLPM